MRKENDAYEAILYKRILCLSKHAENLITCIWRRLNCGWQRGAKEKGTFGKQETKPDNVFRYLSYPTVIWRIEMSIRWVATADVASALFLRHRYFFCYIRYPIYFLYIRDTFSYKKLRFSFVSYVCFLLWSRYLTACLTSLSPSFSLYCYRCSNVLFQGNSN